MDPRAIRGSRLAQEPRRLGAGLARVGGAFRSEDHVVEFSVIGDVLRSLREDVDVSPRSAGASGQGLQFRNLFEQSRLDGLGPNLLAGIVVHPMEVRLWAKPPRL